MLQMAHIGDVAHVAHLVTEVFQIAEKNIKRDGRTGMSQMGIAINGLLLPMQSIVNQKCLFHIF